MLKKAMCMYLFNNYSKLFLVNILIMVMDGIGMVMFDEYSSHNAFVNFYKAM